MRHLSAVSLVLVLMAGSVWAQDSPVLNRLEPRMPDFLENTRGEGIPDTTEPWRYFPLEVGNTWEYLQTDGMIKRRYVENDTLIEGTRFFIVNGQNFSATGDPMPLINRRPFRFDTLTAQVIGWIGFERPWFWGCSFDQAFCSMCYDNHVNVGGGYDYLLAFPTSSGADSVYTAVKILADIDDHTTLRFAADFGEIFHYCDECGFGWGLQAVRIGGWDGEVFGELLVPPPITSNEEGFSSNQERRFEAWPNPFQNDLNISFSLAQASRTSIEIIDLLGRTVEYEDLGFRVQGEHTITLNPGYLTPGLYVLRMMTEEGAMVRRVTRVN